MQLIPATAVAVWCSALPHRDIVLDQMRPFLVQLGSRMELDVDAYATSHPSAYAEAQPLLSWWSANQKLWASAAIDKLSGLAWTKTRRRIVDATQSTAKKDKKDLGEQYFALTDSGPFVRLITEATTAFPDTGLVSAMSKALGGGAKFELGTSGDVAPVSAVLTVPMVGTLLWPDALGGPAWPGEISRELTVNIRYAPWRDRRLRRVAGVAVDVSEIWADPSQESLVSFGTKQTEKVK